MAKDPWYKAVTLHRAVREGRSFGPDEFAIALEQAVAGTAPADYSDPAQFFSRACRTRGLKDHAGMAPRRLSGKTENTAPVLTLVTRFGGGKTHTLTALYSLARADAGALNFVNRHRGMAESFHAFIQNLTVEVTGVRRLFEDLGEKRIRERVARTYADWLADPKLGDRIEIERPSSYSPRKGGEAPRR